MKTIIFHSYKGGQGRTTCLANIAGCLFRLGHKVCLLDLDLDSPGLPPKFQKSVFDERGEVADNGGVFNHLLSLIGGADHSDRALRDRCIPLGDDLTDDLWSRLVLLPTYYVGPNFFENRKRENWRELTAPGQIDYAKVRAFKRLIADIKALPGGPDYVLVDLPSGLTHLAEIILTVLAETVVLFFSLDQENLEGTGFVYKQALGDRIPLARRDLRLENQDEPITVVPVLSRVGPFLSTNDILEFRERAALHIFEDKGRFEEIFIARVDPDLEHAWQLHVPPDQNPATIKNVALTRDYLQLLVRIAPEAISPVMLKMESAIAMLIERLGLNREIEDRYKIFRLDGGGVMVNLTDESSDPRNVSFKVQTFCSILDDIHDQILRPTESVGLSPEPEEEQLLLVRRQFLHAGKQSGERFGRNLIDMWSKHGGLPDKVERLAEWCKFDSQVGFGRLRSKWSVDAQGIVGTVEVMNNFLAHHRTGADKDLCVLMIGYVQGVLECILEDAVVVEHPDRVCMRVNTELPSCVFEFKTAKRDPN
jgi:predicted hydrocarbon binding protein